MRHYARPKTIVIQAKVLPFKEIMIQFSHKHFKSYKTMQEIIQQYSNTARQKLMVSATAFRRRK